MKKKKEGEEFQLKLILAWKQAKNERFRMKKRSEDRMEPGVLKMLGNHHARTN